MKARTKFNQDGSVNRIIEASNGDFAVDLFPYKIQNRELFYDRNHPINISPESFEYELYWGERLKNYLEGRWIYDVDTWVFMPPKLDFYINYMIIVDEDRKKIPPRLRDNEWIMSYYDLCAEGFSGFELDEEYTCHELVGKIEKIQRQKEQGDKNPDEIKEFEKKILDSSTAILREDGTYKKFIPAWEYLTEHYLITHKADKPLGSALYENNKSDEMILACRAAAKALKPDELVLTQYGWEKIKNIKVGDRVYGSDGKLCNVTQTTGIQKNLNMYKIKLRDGREIDSCEDHLWKVWDKNLNRKGEKNHYSVLSTKDIFENPVYDRIDSKYKKRHGEIKRIIESKYFLPLNSPIEYSEKDLPIDPYFLGLWIGDGHSHRPEITTEDEEIRDYCYKIAEEWKHKVTVSTKPDNKASSYHITKGRFCKREDRTLLDKFIELNLLNNKHIPRIYLESSIEQRLELLRGLMDSDGTASSRHAVFSNSNKNVVDDFVELSRSLGIYTTIFKKQAKLYGVEKKICYKVSLKTTQKIFNLERKHSLHTSQKPKGKVGAGRFERVGIIGIEKIDNHDGVCIAVDNEDRTYITKDFIVTHNSFFTFGGNFMHEWLTNGAKSVQDFIKDGSTQKLFAAGSVRKDQLERSMSIVKRFYNSMPGNYTYGVDDKGKEDKVFGFLYKSIVGTWDVGTKVEHKVPNTDNTIAISGNVMQLSVITPDAITSLAGDRMAMIIIEEVGFLSYVKRVRSAFRNSLRVGKKKIGKAIYLGTGGDMEAIQDSKEMFESPDGFEIYALPNYFDKNRAGSTGLFLSACLQSEEFKDENGNTIYEQALGDVIDQREREFENSDSTSFWEFVAFNPLYPREMLRPSSKSVLPVIEMTEHRGVLMMTDIWKHRSSIGTFRWDPTAVAKVSWRRDVEQKMYPINDWGKDKELHNREGAWIMYEDVMENRPDNLYYILYDPAAQGGEGTSLHSALVYKHRFTGGNKSLQETFIAEFIGRKPKLEQNYEEIIRAALYYNAKILVERNVPGFSEWCESKGYYHLLLNEPTRVLTEVRRQPVKYSGRKGIRTDDAINKWNITKLGEWLRDPIMEDEDGTPIKFRFQSMYSLRLLDEAINFKMERKTEFDHMSSAMLLMPLLLEISDESIEIVDDFEDINKSKYSKYSQIDYGIKKRSKFLETV
jgi:hypothetical protein